jgi:hypothetical protein
MTDPLPHLAALHVDVEGGRVLLLVSRLDSATATACKLSPEEAELMAQQLLRAARVVREGQP